MMADELVIENILTGHDFIRNSISSPTCIELSLEGETASLHIQVEGCRPGGGRGERQGVVIWHELSNSHHCSCVCHSTSKYI